jgi:hypothetical protein
MNRKNPFLLIILLISFAGSAHAQILKVNKNNLNKDSSGYWLGAISFHFNLNNRSVSSDNENAYIGLTGTTDVVYVGDNHAYISINNINYFTSSADDGAFISTGYSHFRINWERQKRLSYESYGQIQYDKGRNMTLRFLVGSGIRYRFSDSDKTLLVIGTGIMHEDERWKVLNAEDQFIDKNIWKNSSYINGAFQLTKALKLDAILFYQGGYDGESEVFRNRINTDIQLSISISNRLSFVADFSGQYEDKPIIDINKFIYQVRNGITWTF